jgi:hypothetical protein
VRFEEITYCDYPASEVFGAMVWHLEDLVPYMDNVAEIRTDSFDQSEPGKIKTLRFWQGTSANVPALLRPFVSKNSLGWKDIATWIPSEYKVEWKTETKHSKYSSCEGVNYFEPDPEAPATRTRCVISGDFTVHGDRLPAMPKFIGLKIAPKLESIILGYMIPNFRQLAIGIAKYLDAKKKAAAQVGERSDVAAG